jgi:CheY-like chemotaxis protein
MLVVFGELNRRQSHMKTRVLLIDGHDEFRGYLAHRLRACSREYEVLEARDGKAGLHLSSSEIFDCVVFDYNLPDVSGFYVLTRLVPRPQHPQVAVIVLTDTGLPHLSQILLTNGAQACMPKIHTTGDGLDLAIQKAVAKLGPTRKEYRDSDWNDES